MTKKIIIKKPELLAPAGNLEKMKTAFAFGADAVYLGVPSFSLRVRINDFDMPKIKIAVDYAHELDKKAYVTVNIFAHNKHLDKLPAHINELKKIGPDGIFISDPGIMTEIKKLWPKANIILSTQANCTNWRSAEFWQKQGMSRVILGRELSLPEIKEIRKKLPKLELECFVHGALCMAYSGRCFLSKLMVGRDANLGDCAQPCRWQYKTTIETQGHDALELVEEEHGSYILNSEDLCLVKKIPELIKARLSAFKIEGRAKSVYYLASVVGAYRQAIDHPTDKKGLNYLYQELEEKLYHRGYTEGFMFGQGQLAQNLKNSHNVPEWEFCGQVISRPAKAKINFSQTKKYIIFLNIHNTLKTDDQIEILEPYYKVSKLKIDRMWKFVGNLEIKEAHGGGKDNIVYFESDVCYPELSVLRRKIVKNN